VIALHLDAFDPHFVIRVGHGKGIGATLKDYQNIDPEYPEPAWD